MEAKTELEIKQLQKLLQKKHPGWPQDKARWIAMLTLSAGARK